MSHARTVVTVDAQLDWVVRVPEQAAGATRAASAEQLRHLAAAMDAAADAARGVLACGLAGLVAEAVLEALGEPPALPFIGEPFGGEGGTD